jgi:large subunit ribosomal protein L7/L12
MAKLSSTDLLKAFKEMTLLELSGFVKDFETTFGVTASIPVTGEHEPVPDITPEEDVQTEFDVVLEATGDKKILVIKEVRTLTQLGLKEAKDFVEAAPRTVLEGADQVTAERAKLALEKAGATVALR